MRRSRKEGGGKETKYSCRHLEACLTHALGSIVLLPAWAPGFARCLLGEEITPLKTAGAALIVAGVVLCLLGTPTDGGDGDDDGSGSGSSVLTPSDVEELAARPLGIAYACFLVAVVFASVAAISW